MALFVLLLALIAHAPTEHCTCHDSNKPKKQDCPFGTIRQCASSFLVPSAPEIVPRLVSLGEVEFSYYGSFGRNAEASGRARSPPARS